MYDQLFVRKRRRRRIAALIALFSSIGITGLVIISFLGRSVGTFTVSLNNSDVKLALCEKVDSTNYSSYLRVNNTAKYVETDFMGIQKDHSLESLDNENTPYNCGEFDQTYVDESDGKVKVGKCLEFFKYTFYVKNVGSKNAAYNLKINIDDRTRSNDDTERGLDDTLRVMVFENNPNEDTHNYLVYAKKAYENNINLENKEVAQEFISNPDWDKRKETEEYRLAEVFKDNKTVAEYTVSNFDSQEMKRYTVVIWLDGNDPQSKPDTEYPEGATLKLGVDIAAHENK